MDNEATATVEEGVVVEESPVSTENRPIIEDKVEDAPEKVEKQEEKQAPRQPKHATAQDRIRYLDKENKSKESLLAEKDRRIKELEDTTSKKAVSDIVRPKSEDFETDEDFNVAIDKYYDDRSDARSAEKDKAVLAENAQKAHADQWNPFFDRIDSLPEDQRQGAIDAASDETISYSAVMQNVVQQSDTGPQLVQHFHNNKDVAEAISKMPMLQAVNEMNRITQNIVKASSAKTVSSAPQPVSPVSSGDATANKDPDSMSPEEWREWRNERTKVF